MGCVLGLCIYDLLAFCDIRLSDMFLSASVADTGESRSSETSRDESKMRR
jgi:hypothetical protein